MNRRAYQKRKNKFEIFNKKVKRFAEAKWYKLEPKEKEHFKEIFYCHNKKEAFERYRENLKWSVHLNYATMDSWNGYKKKHMPLKKCRKEFLKMLDKSRKEEAKTKKLERRNLKKPYRD